MRAEALCCSVVGHRIATSWFETREDALLTMRVRDLILRSIAKAMRLEG